MKTIFREYDISRDIWKRFKWEEC